VRAALPIGGAVVQVKEKHRWSANKKAELVLRLLRGEDIETVSRKVKVTAFALTRWRDEFLEGGTEALRKQPRTEPEQALRAAQAQVGELTMQVKILQELHRKRGLQLTPLRSVHSSQEGGGRCRWGVTPWGWPVPATIAAGRVFGQRPTETVPARRGAGGATPRRRAGGDGGESVWR